MSNFFYMSNDMWTDASPFEKKLKYFSLNCFYTLSFSYTNSDYQIKVSFDPLKYKDK